MFPPRPTTPAAALATALLLVGCVGGRGWNPFAEAAAPALSPASSREEVVAHLNGNVERCTGWRCTEVKINLNGVPISASGMMAVESPRNFRMQVSSIMGDLADLGSNDERMWFWTRPQGDEPQYVHTCAHEDLVTAQSRLTIPFRPDWLMEVLGVIPIDPAQVDMEVNPGDAGQFLLSSYQTADDGTQVKRVMTVDAKKGVVVGHTLWAVDESSGRLIAQAKLSDHRRDEATGVMLPHRLELSYPAANAGMTLALKDIEINPASVTPNTWQPNVAADCPFKDIATDQVVTLDRAGTY